MSEHVHHDQLAHDDDHIAHDDVQGSHGHGFDSFLDRWWQAFVIGLGCVAVFVLTHYNPVGH